MLGENILADLRRKGKLDYFIEDFTESNYKRLLILAKDKSRITTYEDALKNNGIVWRHDVDLSINRALALNNIEKDLGVKAYYFIHLHSSFYNVMESSITKKIKQISEGAIIGLHFEPSYYNLKTDDIETVEKWITYEKEILENLIDIEVSYMSFHNPDVGGNWHLLPQERIGGLFNVYCDNIRNNFEYCSDSNGYWRYKRLEDVLADVDKNTRLHVLTHPGWWTPEKMLPFERIKRCIQGRANNALETYCELLKECGRINVGYSENEKE